MLVESVEEALKNINPRYCELSKAIYSKSEIGEYLAEEKYLERPFAYEFYHQFRKLLDAGRIDLKCSVIQAEVDKRYQHIENLGKIPDFILHTPNSAKRNLAVIEFKLASNCKRPLEADLAKLVAFRQAEATGYETLIEVIVGNTNEIAEVWRRLDTLGTAKGEEITVIALNINLMSTKSKTIIYEPKSAI